MSNVRETDMITTEELKEKVRKGFAQGSVMPSRDGVIVTKRQSGDHITKSGVIIPESAQNKDKELTFGVVYASGKGVYTDDGHLIPHEINIGDVACFQQWSGKTIAVYNNIEYISVRYKDIECIVTGGK